MSNKEVILGVDTSTFNLTYSNPRIENLLYYGNTQITDKYYIRNVYVLSKRNFVNKGKHFIYVVGDVQVGDYLTTCPIRGAALVTKHKELAFARVVCGRGPSLDVKYPVIGGCYVEFL